MSYPPHVLPAPPEVRQYPQRGISRAVWLGPLMLVGACILLQMPGQFAVSGIETSALEILVCGWFAWVWSRAGLHRHKRTYGILMLSAVPAIIIGAADNELARVARDTAQLIYVAAFFAGAAYVTRRANGLADVIRLAWIATSIYGTFLAADIWILRTGEILGAQAGFRLVAAFATVTWCASLLRLDGVPRVHWLSSGVIAIALVLFYATTRTRAVHLMLIGALTVLAIQFAATSERRRRRWLSLTAAALITASVIAVMWSIGLPEGSWGENGIKRFEALFQDGYDRDITVTYRLDAWRYAWEEFREHPVTGAGFGSYLLLDPWIRQEYGLYPATMIHNTLLQIVYNGGIVHLVGYLIFFATIARHIGATVGARQAGRAFLAGFAIYSIFGVTLSKPTEAVMFWFCLGLLCGTDTPWKGPCLYLRTIASRPVPLLKDRSCSQC